MDSCSDTSRAAHQPTDDQYCDLNNAARQTIADTSCAFDGQHQAVSRPSARIHANVPEAVAEHTEAFAGADIRDEGGTRKSMGAWLLRAHRD